MDTCLLCLQPRHFLPWGRSCLVTSTTSLLFDFPCSTGHSIGQFLLLLHPSPTLSSPIPSFTPPPLTLPSLSASSLSSQPSHSQNGATMTPLFSLPSLLPLCLPRHILCTKSHLISESQFLFNSFTKARKSGSR